VSCRRVFFNYRALSLGRRCQRSSLRLSLGLIVLFCVLSPLRSFGAEADPKFKPGEELLDAGRVAQAEEFAAKAAR